MGGHRLLLFGHWVRFQVILLPVGFGVLQFGRQFPRVAARIEMVGVIAGFFLAPVLACARKRSKTKCQKPRRDESITSILLLCCSLTAMAAVDQFVLVIVVLIVFVD